MATLKYYIRDKKSRKEISINYRINFSATQKLRGSTGLKVLPKFWDEDKQKVRNRIEVSEIKDFINNKLIDFEKFIFNKINNYETNVLDEVIELLKNDVSIYFGKKRVEKKLTFYEFIRKFIDQSQGRVSSVNNRPLSKRTIQDYERTLKMFIEFEKVVQYPMTFESINLDFYYNFLNYLEEKDYSLNTIGKFIKILKVFLNEATEQGINNNLVFRSKKFTRPSEKSFQIYLNEEELTRMIMLDLSDDKTLDIARDLFIIGSYTGLRVSDFNNLSEDNIEIYKGKKILKLIVKKTNASISIPIHPRVEEVIKKYNGGFPKKIPDQHINTALKVIGERAKINEEISYKKIKGGKEVLEKKLKYDMIVNHTARRSFCTNAYINNMPTLDIMAISGHTSEQVFLNYIKIGEKERAIKIANSSFFNVK